MKNNTSSALFAALALLGGTVQPSWAFLTQTNRYDMEPATSFVTQSGWTHMDATVAYTVSTPGFDLANSHFFSPPANDRGASTQSPTDVTRDFVLSFYAPTNTPTFVFRDIVPYGAEKVSFTIYRSDPGDGFGTYFNTFVSYDGGPLVFVPAALEGGFYHTPITGNMEFPHIAATNSTLDYYFYSTIEDSMTNVRLNGIEAIFTVPEASTATLLALACFGIVRFRRGQTKSVNSTQEHQMKSHPKLAAIGLAALGWLVALETPAPAAYTPLNPILDLPNGSFQTSETQIYPYPGSSANYVGTTDYSPANDAFNFEPVFFGLDQGFGYYIKPGNNATPAMTLTLYHKAVSMDGTSDTLTGLGGQLVKGEVASLIDGIAPASSEWFLRFLDSGNSSLGETTKAISYATVYANGYSYGTADELPISAIAPVGATQVELGIRQNFPAANFSDQISFRVDWFRLDIIPEPSTALLAGLGGLVVFLRQRK